VLVGRRREGGERGETYYFSGLEEKSREQAAA
jgi:hypothetical protein